jgi:hypothetical protein
MALDENKKSEISGKLLKIFLKKNMLKGDGGDYNRELGNVAKQINVDVDDLRLFLRPIYEQIFDEILDEHFSPKKAQG